MADRTDTAAATNETRFGTHRGASEDGILFVQAPAGKVSILALQDSDGETHYLWFDTTGDLRVGTAVPTDPQADGSVVGGQS